MDLRIGRFFSYSAVRGEPVSVGNRVITPIARVLTTSARLSAIGLGGSLTWVRPTAVEVLEGGSSRRIPIVNATRRLAAGLAAVLILSGLWQASRRRHG